MYGRYTDQNVYETILNHDYQVFEHLIEELAEALVRDEIDYVTGDAAEGYNPIHDACRLVIDGAVEIVRRGSRSRVLAEVNKLFRNERVANKRSIYTTRP